MYRSISQSVDENDVMSSVDIPAMNHDSVERVFGLQLVTAVGLEVDLVVKLESEINSSLVNTVVYMVAGMITFVHADSTHSSFTLVVILDR